MHIKCRYFSRKNLATGGEEPPPQMPLTVKKKITTEIWDVFIKKTQHRELDAVDGHPSMFPCFHFFAFLHWTIVMIHDCSNFLTYF